MRPCAAKKRNFDKKINNIQNLLNLWSQRDLSLYGRITIAKTLGLSKIVFASCCLHTPQYVAASVSKMVHDFVWNNKPAKIKRNTLIGSKDRGGLDLPDYESISKSLKIGWVTTIKDAADAPWMAIPAFYSKHFGGNLIFDCDYDVSLLDLSKLPAFYIDVLEAWGELQRLKASNKTGSLKDIILWNNRNITVEGKSVYWKSWHTAGVLKIKNLLNENNKFLTYEQFSQKFSLKTPFTHFCGLLSTIPRERRRSLGASAGHPAGLHVKGVTGPSQERVSCRQARTLFIDAKFKEPLASARLCRSGVDPTNLKDIYALPFNMTKETKLSIFQYKIIHNILPYGILLYKMRITDSPYCKHCHELETLDHMLVNCRSDEGRS